MSFRESLAMKYDKPVWELMGSCALDLPGQFRFNHVRAWFDTHYPDIDDGTLRVHLIGLTASDNNASAFLATKTPLFRRVGHGHYEVIGREAGDEGSVVSPSSPEPATGTKPRGRPVSRKTTSRRPRMTPDTAAPEPVVEPTRSRPVDELFGALPHQIIGPRIRQADSVLVGDPTAQLDAPAMAKDLYVSEQFTKDRDHAESSGAPWFVLSPTHGLALPDEWLSPHRSRPLEDDDYCAAWAVWVVARLAMQLGTLEAKTIDVMAPQVCTDALRSLLESRGAVVIEPAQRRAAQDQAGAAGSDGILRAMTRDVAALLGNRMAPVRVDDLGEIPDKPGLYSWWVDASGARDLALGLRVPVEAGLLYVGQAGATGADDSATSLHERIAIRQLDGTTLDSSFRLSIASILRRPLRLHSIGDDKVLRWMHKHLRLIVAPIEGEEHLDLIKQDVVRVLDPLLNLDHVESSAVRIMLRDLRRGFQR